MGPTRVKGPTRVPLRSQTLKWKHALLCGPTRVKGLHGCVYIQIKIQNIQQLQNMQKIQNVNYVIYTYYKI